MYYTRIWYLYEANKCLVINFDAIVGLRFDTAFFAVVVVFVYFFFRLSFLNFLNGPVVRAGNIYFYQ